MSDTTNTQSDLKSGLVSLPKDPDVIKADVSSKNSNKTGIKR